MTQRYNNPLLIVFNAISTKVTKKINTKNDTVVVVWILKM